MKKKTTNVENVERFGIEPPFCDKLLKEKYEGHVRGWRKYSLN